MDEAYAEAIAARREKLGAAADDSAGAARSCSSPTSIPRARDAGAQRPAAMAKWLRRPARVTVLTDLGAYGSAQREQPSGSCARVDLQTAAGAAGRPRRSRLAVRLRHLLGPAPPAQQGDRAGAARRSPGRRSRAAPRSPPIASDRFDCVITTSPPESAHLIGHALRRRGVPWVADVRDAWTFEPLRPAFPTRLQRRLDERLERRCLGAADAVVCVSRAGGGRPARARHREPGLIRNAWDPDEVRAPRPGRGDGPARRPRGPRSSTPAASAATAATRRRSSPRSAGSPPSRPTPADAARARVAGPLTDAERRLLERRERPAGSESAARHRCRADAARPAARGRRAAAARPADPRAARQLQALRVPRRRVARPRARRGHRGRTDRRRRRHRPDRRRRRSRGDRDRARRDARRCARGTGSRRGLALQLSRRRGGDGRRPRGGGRPRAMPAGGDQYWTRERPPTPSRRRRTTRASRSSTACGRSPSSPWSSSIVGVVGQVGDSISLRQARPPSEHRCDDLLPHLGLSPLSALCRPPHRRGRPGRSDYYA